MQVPLLDLKAQYQAVKEPVDAAVRDVFESQMFINGPQVKECELKLAEYCESKFSTGVSSGSDALIVPLMVEGIGPGDEVITPAYSFFATAGAVSRLGATPVFVDIDADTFNVDPQKVIEAITPKTRAIIAVHLFGQTADIDPLLEIARKHNLILIEDAAQAIGSEYKGKRAGSMGDYGCFSFFPSKNLGCAGDGGLITTNDPVKDEQLKMIRNHGAKVKYHHLVVGGNFRLDTLHAAVVLAKLPFLEGWHEARRVNAERYRKLFAASSLVGNGVNALPVDKMSRHIYNQFVIRVQDRDELMAWLKVHDVGCEVYYPRPFHKLECFANLGYRDGAFPVSETAANESLAIPIYPELTESMQEFVVETIRQFYKSRRGK